LEEIVAAKMPGEARRIARAVLDNIKASTSTKETSHVD
jgi:hypothetical protein